MAVGSVAWWCEVPPVSVVGLPWFLNGAVGTTPSRLFVASGEERLRGASPHHAYTVARVGQRRDGGCCSCVGTSHPHPGLLPPGMDGEGGAVGGVDWSCDAAPTSAIGLRWFLNEGRGGSCARVDHHRQCASRRFRDKPNTLFGFSNPGLWGTLGAWPNRLF
jgi:hypothetical protein